LFATACADNAIEVIQWLYSIDQKAIEEKLQDEKFKQSLYH
jgi:hypothetical protein